MRKIDVEIALVEGFRNILSNPAILLPSFISSLLFSYLFYRYLKVKPENLSPEESMVLLKLTFTIVLLAIFFDSVVVRFAYSRSFDAFAFAIKRYPTVLTTTVTDNSRYLSGRQAILLHGRDNDRRGEGAISSLKKAG